MENEDKEEYEVEVLEEAEVVGEVKEVEPVEAQILEGTPPYEEKKGFFSQFPKTFWIVNTLELFERGAYYGMLPVLMYYIHVNIGVQNYVLEGFLFAMLMIFSYFWPIVAAALAEKYGYRHVMFVAFGLLMSGYYLTAVLGSGQLGLLVLALIFIGFGAGTFKPLISATIAHVTDDKQRNLAYSLYYWFINFGAFITPIILKIFIRSDEWYFVIFIFSGALITINLIIEFILYPNPVEPQRELSLPNALKRIIPALKDRKFNRLLIIYSGFWFMYSVNHSYLPLYMIGFKKMPSWFDLLALAPINPGTIILLGPFLGKLVEKYKSLNVMMVGIMIYIIGILMVFFSGSPIMFFTGVIVYSIGEFITHPGFIAYVSKIAPKDKVAIYMGAIFISTGAGVVIGPAIQGIWYDYFAIILSRPKVFGAAIAAVGSLTIACLILYNKWINKIAKQEDYTYQEDTSIWTKVTSAGVAFMFIPIIIGFGYVGGTDTYYGLGEEESGTGSGINWSRDYDLISGSPINRDGYLDEGTETVEQISISNENIKNVIFTLTWTDEPDTYGLGSYENQPDSFSLEVQTPEGKTDSPESGSNPHGNQGSISIPVPFEPNKDPFKNGTGNYNVTITCTEAGDQEPQINIIGIRVEEDPGNDWELTVEYEYYKKKE